MSRYLALARDHNGKLLPRGHPRGESYGHHRTLGGEEEARNAQRSVVSVSMDMVKKRKSEEWEVCGGPMSKVKGSKWYRQEARVWRVCVERRNLGSRKWRRSGASAKFTIAFARRNLGNRIKWPRIENEHGRAVWP